MIGKLRAWAGRLRRRTRSRTDELRERYPQYEIGRGTYGLPDIRAWNEGATFRIGAFCSIADGVTIYLGGEHRMDWVTTYPFNWLWRSAAHIPGHPATKGDVVIGNDVWIGADAMILSGVRIGDGAVVGARALVTSDVEPYAIHAGNPARLVRMRFDEATVRQLLELAWWDFADDEIERLLPALTSPDIGAFLTAARRIRTG